MNISLGATNNNTIADPMLTRNSGANRTSESPTTSSGDAAVVSLGSSIDQFKTQLDAMPEVSGGRVEQLRTMVEQGTYAVNPVNVANAMFSTLFGES